MALIVYLSASTVALVALSYMIHRIAAALGDCPQTGAVARAAGVTLTTGFAAIGAGAVLLISVLAVSSPYPQTTLFAIGLACVVLGLGFTQAITTLRAAVRDARAKAVPMEPVLA